MPIVFKHFLTAEIYRVRLIHLLQEHMLPEPTRGQILITLVIVSGT